MTGSPVKALKEAVSRVVAISLTSIESHSKRHGDFILCHEGRLGNKARSPHANTKVSNRMDVPCKARETEDRALISFIKGPLLEEGKKK